MKNRGGAQSGNPISTTGADYALTVLLASQIFRNSAVPEKYLLEVIFFPLCRLNFKYYPVTHTEDEHRKDFK